MIADLRPDSPCSLLWVFNVGDPSEIPLRRKQCLLICPIEVGAVDGAGEVGDEHPSALEIQSETDTFHQVIEDDFGFDPPIVRGIHWSPVDCVSLRWISTVSPIKHS